MDQTTGVLCRYLSDQDYLLDACTKNSRLPESGDEDDIFLSDFGEQYMSVCIAAISDVANEERRIVCVTDRKASSVEFSNDDASVKQLWFHSNWLAMFAGEDISPCVPIITAVMEEVKGKENTFENVRLSFERCFQKYLSNLATAKQLGRWQLSMEEFLATGRKKFGPDNFDAMWSEIQQVRLQCRFLVCGFDGVGNPHIFTVRNPGYSEVADTPGYFAIGNGASAALSVLGFLKQNVVQDVWHTYYNVWAAKFMAERATDVGQFSFVCEIGPTGVTTTSRHFQIENVARKAWDNGGKPSVPDGIVEEIKDIINAS